MCLYQVYTFKYIHFYCLKIYFYNSLGSKNKNFITTPKQTPFSTPICSPAVTPRNRSPQNNNLGSPRAEHKINLPK